ncbi:helix-turn-helix domain-containing protein [Amycolatopsis thermoflava]|uniref:helix-turn-helix domain-containing protein n=1 Tax=Amycolatopsis thermoflava TaxID=84480 RepID=UPI003F49D3D4
MAEESEEDRRKFVGRRIKRARRRAGYRSQKAFADVIGLAENSVARAEIGDPRVGEAVFEAIEDGLEWPPDTIAQYLETGDETVLPKAAASTPAAETEKSVQSHTGPSLAEQLLEIEIELTEIAAEERRLAEAERQLAERRERAMTRAAQLLGQSSEQSKGERRVG